MNSSGNTRCSDFNNIFSSRDSTGADVSRSSCNYDKCSVREIRKRDIHKPKRIKHFPEPNSVEETLLFTSTDLPDDLRLITEIPDMCDVKFVIGQSQEDVYGIKAVLAMRCRYFYDLIMLEQQKNRDTKKKLKKTRSLSSRLFRKRKSDKTRNSHLVIEVDGVDANIFTAVIRYLHSGKIKLTRNNVISVFIAAEKFGLRELVTVCKDLIHELITMRTVLSLLDTLQSYSSHKSLDSIMEKVLTFIDKNAQNLLPSAQFEYVTKFSADKILTRDNLLVSQEIRWDATLRWSRQHCKGESLDVFKEIVKPYLSNVKFGEIPLRKLTWQILPLGIIPDDVIRAAISLHSESREVADSCQKPEVVISGSDVVDVAYNVITTGLFSESRELNGSDCCQNTVMKIADFDGTEGSYLERSLFFNGNDFLDEILEEESRLSSLFDVSVSSSEVSQ